LAVDQDQGDSRVLLGMPALTELKILVDCEAYSWEYKAEKTTIKIDLYQRFRKHTQRAKIYALVKVNHLLRSQSPDLINELPACLQHYLNVFSKTNAEKLALNRDINLAIDLLPGKEPLYRPIYPLSPRELVALKEFLEKNLAKRFIQESKSPADAPILFASKKDGSLRLYVDY
jgi:hypothetical protein